MTIIDNERVTAVDADLDRAFGRIVDELTRRGLLAGGLATTALAGVAACSPDRPAPAAGSPSTRRVQGAYGPVDLPVRPGRIVAFPSAPLSTLLDLGGTAVGTDDDEASVMVPANRNKAAAVPSIGSWGSISAEKIAARTPDLIISTTGWVDDKLYSQLAAVAPTLIIDDSKASWEQVATATAQAVGREDQLAALRTSYADRLAAVRRSHAAALRNNSWEIIQDADTGTFYRWMSNSDPARVLTALGATLGNRQPIGPDTSYVGAELSYEKAEAQLGKADVILCPKLSIDTLTTQPTVSRLSAVKAGHLFASDWLFVFGYSAATALVDQIAEICTRLEKGKR